jgi:hypothetical protein
LNLKKSVLLGALTMLSTLSVHALADERFAPLTIPYNGLCMGSRDARDDNFSPIVQRACGEGFDQQFEFLPDPENVGYYKIAARRYRVCLGISESSLDNGAELTEMPCYSDADAQLFRPVFDGANGFSLVAKHSGKCVDVYGDVLDQGASVVQWSCHGGRNQKFQTSTVIPMNDVIRGNMDKPQRGNFSWDIGKLITQEFKVGAAGFPTELAVLMGSPNDREHVDVILYKNNAEVFRHTFLDTIQRHSDWATVFPLKGIENPFQPGDRIRMSIMPYSRTSYVVMTPSADWPMSSSGSGALMFTLKGSTSPDMTPYPERESPHIRASTGQWSASGGSMLPENTVFTQKFKALQPGIPSELCLRMGIGVSQPYDVNLSISVGSEKIFEKAYFGIKQIWGGHSDEGTAYCGIFDISGISRNISIGEEVSFTFSSPYALALRTLSEPWEVGITGPDIPGKGRLILAFDLK